MQDFQRRSGLRGKAFHFGRCPDKRVAARQGDRFSTNGFGNWMRDRCDEAGLPSCSSHGLRKACARRLTEAGCSNQEIKAITGHETEAEVTRYTKAADQKKLAKHAMGKLIVIDPTDQSANHPQKVSNSKD